MKKHFLLSLFLLVAPSVSAQIASSAETCVPNQSSAIETSVRWAGNTKVTVYAMRSAFAPAELAAIRRAVDNWNEALTETRVDVKFSFGGERDAAAGANTILIDRGATFQNQRHLAEIYPVMANSRDLSSASITIDTGVTHTEVMTSVLTHELGHSLGINDCPRCRRGTTIMALYGGRNKGNKVVSPTRCDRLVVARGYHQSIANSKSESARSASEFK